VTGLGGVEESSTVESWQPPLSEGRAVGGDVTLFVLHTIPSRLRYSLGTAR
jgi:hypothetical protein